MNDNPICPICQAKIWGITHCSHAIGNYWVRYRVHETTVHKITQSYHDYSGVVYNIRPLLTLKPGMLLTAERIETFLLLL